MFLLLFVLAHTLRARGSDGHQRFVVGQLFLVCQRTDEMQKAGCLRWAKQTSSETNKHELPATDRHLGD